jgi:hypothetical protein
MLLCSGSVADIEHLRITAFMVVLLVLTIGYADDQLVTAEGQRLPTV